MAEDALQETFYLLAKISQPQHIDDLRKYFCKVLIHSVYRLRGQLGAVPWTTRAGGGGAG